jgi:methyl-accepting chemotaxis protein
MAERYLANNKKTPQGVANVEVILFKPPHARKVERTNRAMERTNRAMERTNRAMERANRAMERTNRAMERENRAMERILIPLKW